MYAIHRLPVRSGCGGRLAARLALEQAPGTARRRSWRKTNEDRVRAIPATSERPEFDRRGDAEHGAAAVLFSE